MDLSGVWIWIWNVGNCDGGSAARIVARLKANGASGVLVKVADDDHSFNDWNAVYVLGATLRMAGLGFGTWSYCYGANPTGEAAIAVQALQRFNPDVHVFDVEQEFEDVARPDLAALALVQDVRASVPNAPLAYSPLPAIRYHLRAPYRQFTDAGLSMLPQLYWTGLGWSPDQTCSVFYSDAATYELTGQPIFPAYEDAVTAGAGANDADLATFCGLVLAQGATGVSVWSYEHLTDVGWSRVAQAAAAFQVQPIPVPVPVPVPTPTPVPEYDNNDFTETIRQLTPTGRLDPVAGFEFLRQFQPVGG